jgi:hypothetical protein
LRCNDDVQLRSTRVQDVGNEILKLNLDILRPLRQSDAKSLEATVVDFLADPRHNRS